MILESSSMNIYKFYSDESEKHFENDDMRMFSSGGGNQNLFNYSDASLLSSIDAFLNRTSNLNYKSIYSMQAFTIRFIDALELYLIPIIVAFGIVGNFIGSICLLSNRALRKCTILFILSVIGLVDNLFLFTQLQRWLALSTNKKFILSDILCKMYFFLIRFSLLTSSALLLALLLIRFIKLYLGSYYLSLYSNVGQMCSRLCIVYIVALTTSTNWHQVWTSGIYSTKSNILLPENYNSLNISMAFSFLTMNYEYLVHCIENIESEILAQIINYFNILILLIIYLLLIVLSILIFVKICKKVDRVFYKEYGSFSETTTSSRIGQLITNGGSTQATPLRSTATAANSASLTVQFNRRKSTVSTQVFSSPLHDSNSVCMITASSSRTSSKKIFTRYLIVIALMNSLFGLSYVLSDILTYKYVYVERLNVDLENCLSFMTCNVLSINIFIKKLFKKTLLRLPLVLINLNFSIKFYLLFFWYKKFRVEMYKFLHLRAHFDMNLFFQHLQSIRVGKENKTVQVDGIGLVKSAEEAVVNMEQDAEKQQQDEQSRIMSPKYKLKAKFGLGKTLLSLIEKNNDAVNSTPKSKKSFNQNSFLINHNNDGNDDDDTSVFDYNISSSASEHHSTIIGGDSHHSNLL